MKDDIDHSMSYTAHAQQIANETRADPHQCQRLRVALDRLGHLLGRVERIAIALEFLGAAHILKGRVRSHARHGLGIQRRHLGAGGGVGTAGDQRRRAHADRFCCDRRRRVQRARGSEGRLDFGGIHRVDRNVEVGQHVGMRIVDALGL